MNNNATTPWTITDADLAARVVDARSSVFTVGNGRFCTRGTFADAWREAGPPYPFRCTYLAGLYTLAGWGMDHLLCGPDWTAAAPDVEGAGRMDGAQTLDMKRGVLTSRYRCRAGETVLTVTEERFVSWAHPNLACQRITVTPETGETEAALVLGIDGDVRNHPSKEYKPGRPRNCDERGIRLSEVETCEVDGEVARVVLRALSTRNRASALAVLRADEGLAVSPADGTDAGFAGWRVSGRATPDRPLVVEKCCAVAGDQPGREDALEATGRPAALRSCTYATALAAHVEAVDAFWRRADVCIEGDASAQTAVRFALWSTRIAAPLDDGGASIGPKNLTGDWYRGGVFWDMDMYQLPLLAAVDPARAVNHVRYRVRLLGDCRSLAAQDGYDGARYPFVTYDRAVERMLRLQGLARQQLHINSDVAWGILHTYALTGDENLLLEGGLEALAAISMFWLSFVSGPDADGQYHIRNICGPDELHPGVDDNTYTNELTAYVLRATAGLVDRLREDHPERVDAVTEAWSFNAEARARARDIAARLCRPTLPDGTPAQFAGFEDQPEPDVTLRNKWGAGDKTNKQADTVMLHQALPLETDPAWLERVYDYYVPLCTQTSSLSPASHVMAAAALRRGRDARRFFDLAAGTDLADSLGNTRYGIHGATQGGVWMAAVHGFGGLRVGLEGVAIDPVLPPGWQRLAYGVVTGGQRLRVDVRRETCTLTNEGEQAVAVTAGGQPVALQPGGTHSFALRTGWKEPRLRAVIFDLDGVLVSTDEYHYRAWKELADAEGVPFDRERNHALRGVSREESLRRIYAERPLPPPDRFREMCERKNARYRELVSNMTPADVLPGAVSLLRALRAEGVKTAIASASRNAPLVLERTGLGDLVDVVADGSCVTRTKPDPQLFTVAAQRCRALPWECVGVEDAESGVEAIHRAGMVSIGIGRQIKEAHLIVEGVAELSADAIRRLFEACENATNPFLETNIAKVEAELT